jgi:hypothetical protein
MPELVVARSICNFRDLRIYTLYSVFGSETSSFQSFTAIMDIHPAYAHNPRTNPYLADPSGNSFKLTIRLARRSVCNASEILNAIAVCPRTTYIDVNVSSRQEQKFIYICSIHILVMDGRVFLLL